jgi:hypothetical protein|tara:strand:+ start:230 stop:745 length:516 start_codon:yes stop_codon:yes gene_type:complete
VPFLGNRPAENYISYDVQHFTTSATTSYTLDHAVANENELRLVINNVVQQPGSSYAYSASGTSLTLTSATSATDTMYCVYLGKATSTVNPPSGSVTNASLNLTYDTKTTASGDGSDTTFTINSGRAVDDVLVFVNGICLVPTDDYTISGTTLTFSTAPTNGAEISIRYLPK